ncbi:MAG: hypothetical protein ABJK36_03585 [Tateyamaria sp.]|uniref:hypothetical protein n=1 Tax=Tateyamaria sp. TaxID=1929288 RepID=UPI00329E0AA7
MNEFAIPALHTNAEAILWVLLSTALFTVIFAAAKFADGAVGTFQILFCATSALS